MAGLQTQPNVLKKLSAVGWIFYLLSERISSHFTVAVQLSIPDNTMRFFVLFLPFIALMQCLGLPDSIQPVKNFNINKYLGRWFEIARLDHSFESGLDRVTAEYSLREDGGLRVLNKGFSEAENKWKQAEGKAYFARGNDEGYLKVSFFGPFYGSYAVFDIDEKNYSYAFISGNTTSFLWLLSRSPDVSKELMDRFIKKSKEAGFDTDSLIFVRQD